VDEVFELRAADVVEFVGCHNLCVGHQEGRVEFRVGDAPCHVAAGDPYLVQNVAMGCDGRVVGLAPRDINRPTCLIAFYAFTGKERTRNGVGDASPRVILVQRALQ